MKKSFFAQTVLGLVLLFLYVPIVLVVAYGFIPNGISMQFTGSDGEFLGFTAKRYRQIFTNAPSAR